MSLGQEHKVGQDIIPSVCPGLFQTHLDMLEGLDNRVQALEVLLVHFGDGARTPWPGSVAYQELLKGRKPQVPNKVSAK